MVISRAYNTFEDVQFGLIKKTSDTDRLADEIQYYRDIQRDINKAIFFPRLVGSHIGTPNWLLLEKYGYDNLGDYMRRYPGANWNSIFAEFIPILVQFGLFTDRTTADVKWNTEQMIIRKTEREFDALVNARPDLTELFRADSIILNGQEYQNFGYMWPRTIRQIIMDEMLEYTSTMIHGDMCFSNILYSQGQFKFIDPRGSYGKQGIWGDQRYDIAKLYHSVDGGYEFFIYNDFDLNGSDTTYTLEFNHLDSKRDILRAFESQILPAYNKKHIKIIQGCIFIGMCARHYDSSIRQTAMYLTGVRILNEALSL